MVAECPAQFRLPLEGAPALLQSLAAMTPTRYPKCYLTGAAVLVFSLSELLNYFKTFYEEGLELEGEDAKGTNLPSRAF